MFRCLDHGRLLIAVGVLLRRVHVALGVNRIVVVPIGDRGAGNARGEELAVRQSERGHVAAVAATADADARRVNPRILADPTHRRLKIF